MMEKYDRLDRHDVAQALLIIHHTNFIVLSAGLESSNFNERNEWVNKRFLVNEQR